MKQLKDIPIRQNKRPKIKRYRTINYCSNSERMQTIFAYVFAYLGGVILFVMAFFFLIIT